MIPDECAAAAMDAARDPDVCLQDKSKRTGSGGDDSQDINDNHTKPSSPSPPPQDDNPATDDDDASLTNGEVPGDTDDAAEGKPEDAGDVEGAKEGEEDVAGVEGSDDERDSSEDDEDKLVISEGNDAKLPGDSTDDNSKGEPPAAPQKAPSRPPTPRRSEKRPAEEEVGPGTPSKRPRPLEDLVSLDALTSVPQVESSLAQLKRDLEAVEFLLKQKEEEWNALLRLQQRKEELYLRLARRRQTLLMRQGGEATEGAEGGEEGRTNLLFLPQGGYSSLGGPQLPLMMMSQLLAGSTSPQALQMVGPAVVRPREGSPGGDGPGNISVIDIHTSTNKPGSDTPKVSLSSEAQSKLTRQLTSSGLASVKPILPKPPGGGGGGGASLAGLPSSLSFSATGHGPQGPTVNVQHLIAAHRKENPNTPPISSKLPAHHRRATRGAWRNRYDGEKRPPPPRDQERPPSVSSSSSDAETRATAPPPKSLLTLSDPSVSYKDVLLRFAELTQIEKQPGSPQISIFPVGSGEGIPKRPSEVSRESTPSMRAQTPPSHPPVSLPSTKPTLEAPSALAKLLLETRAGVSSGGLGKGAIGDPSAVNSQQYLTLSALLSGGSTTTIKDKVSSSHSQSEGRGKKGSQGEEGSGNPKCQGCHKQRAQFVCAGCGNQWYCSRECQVSAWEEHSEHCNN